MNVFKKTISILLVIAFTCSALTGCEMETEEIIEPTSELTIYLGPYDKVFFDQAITMYKYHYNDVNLNVVDISDLSWLEFNEKLRSEIQAGKGPDLIFNCENIFNDINKAVASGAFYDINKLIKNDETFKLSDYNKVVLDAGLFEGKRYIIPISIRVPFLMTTQSIVDETGIDIKKCDNVIGIGEEINHCLNDNKDRRIFKGKSMIYLLSNLLGKNFVDYKTNKLTFDDELIKEFSTLYKSLYPQDKRLPNEILYSSTFDGYNYLSQKQEVFEYYDVRNINELFNNAGVLVWKEEKPIIVPIKTVDKKLQSFVNLNAAISNNSKNKMNAYNFIKVMLSDSVQSYDRCPLDIPVNRESLDKRLVNCKQDIKNGADSYLESQGFMLETPEQAFFDEFSKDVNGIERCTFNDVAAGYLYEYMADYYEDKKSFDECLNNTKVQLEIYITE